MKKLAFIMSAVLAASTAAYAQPWFHGPYQRYDREGYNEGRWHQISDQTHTYSNRQDIDLRESGPLRRMRIFATRGVPFIHRVVVHYMDGSRQGYQIERPLSAKQRQSATIELRGRRVDRVVVVTDPDNISAYQVLGET